jgi:hypothetical protein
MVTVVTSVTVIVETVSWHFVAFVPTPTVTATVGVTVMVTAALQSLVAVARSSKIRPSDPPLDIAAEV